MMSAIERCRTVALGGYVARCEAKAGQLIIEFREADEQPWVDRMIDSRKVMKSFNFMP
jgi:hypothetical protein